MSIRWISKMTRYFLTGSNLLLLLLVAGCQTSGDEGFAIRLLQQDMPTWQFQEANLEALQLKDPPLLSEADIVSYDLESHTLELTESAYRRIQALFTLPVDVDGIPFIVTVGDAPIYGGALWTPVSSLIFDGVIIPQPFESGSRTIVLALGYPSPEVFNGHDPRADARIVKSLKSVGKLN